MTTQLTVRFGLDRHGQPLVVIDGLPGAGAHMSPEQAEFLGVCTRSEMLAEFLASRSSVTENDMATYTEVWKCCECGEIHDDEDGAEDCCKPRIEELYRCDLCKEVHDDEDEAAECCGSGDEDGSLINCPACRRGYRSNEIAAQAVQVAGHCQQCNPMFSIYQQHQIEDLHFDRTGFKCDFARGE